MSSLCSSMYSLKDETMSAAFSRPYFEAELERVKLGKPLIHHAGYHVADALKEPRRPGRRGRSNEFFAAFAAEYIELIHQGSKRPVQELAERRNLSADYVRDVLNQARNRGLLTRPRNGCAGGQLTGKALALLRERD